jgi:hypothetical protein
MALACQLFPRAHVLVPAPTRAGVLRLQGKLSRLLPSEVGLAQGLGQGGPRVQVVTPSTLTHALSEPFDLLLLPDAVAVARAERAFAHLARYPGRRVYGFVRPGEKLGVRERLVLEGLCGRVIYTAPGPRGRAAVRVLLAESPWAPALGVSGALARKKAIWHDGKRNDAIATLAVMLARRQGDQARDLGLLPDDGRPLVRHLGVPRVAVAVESPGHGRELLQRLPGWTLCAGVPAADGVGEVTGRLSRCIITRLMAHKVANLDVDVLIRADGTEWPLTLPGFPPYVPRPGWEVVLVDMADDADARAEDDTRSRLRDYQARGWHICAPARWVRPDQVGRPAPRGRRA